MNHPPVTIDPSSLPLSDMGGASLRLPIPPYLSADWFTARGIADPDALLRNMRSEREVMQPASLRALKATRFSFSRSLLRRMASNKWSIVTAHKDVDRHGAGTLIYEIDAEQHKFHFAVASVADDGTEKTGRFCETSFDFYGSVMDGPVDVPRALSELAEMKEKVWLGRTDNASLGWTVANRSNRFFDYVQQRLVKGKQPDLAVLADGGGYVVRNAGWYGNGRHGSRSWLSLPPNHPLAHPYHLDIFALYMWRAVGSDVVCAAAKAASRGAACLDTKVQKLLGVGNSSGIGMVAALVRWPVWLSAHIYCRELALAYAKTRQSPVSSAKVGDLIRLLRRAAAYYREQPECPVPEITPPKTLAAELDGLAEDVRRYFSQPRDGERPWYELSAIAARYSAEAREQLHSLLIDVEHEFSDEVGTILPRAFLPERRVDPSMTLESLDELVRARYAWALAIDQEADGARAHFWYRSEDNGENRRGERDCDAGVENETFVDVAGAVQSLSAAISRALAEGSSNATVAEFLLLRPDLAHVASRVQLAAKLPYSEIQGNIVARDFLPMDGIRFLLGTMGLEASHPHNTRWVRGVFLQGAPIPSEIAEGCSEEWAMASAASVASGTAPGEAR